jgi:D-sedoheptulose 7-phosphate isomerase
MKNTKRAPAERVIQPAEYAALLTRLLADQDWKPVETLTALMRDALRSGRAVYVCGNGGSAANAIHWANDFVYPVAKHHSRGLRISALTANSAILTCLANDIGYDNVFAYQLRVVGAPGDLLVVLSGSGNSANVLNAVRAAQDLGMKTAAVLGFDGGACREIVDVAVHFKIDDMQIAEDAQLIVNHMVMRALSVEDPGIE